MSACLPKWRPGQSSIPMPAYGTPRVRILGSVTGMLSPETAEVQEDAKTLKIHCSGEAGMLTTAPNGGWEMAVWLQYQMQAVRRGSTETVITRSSTGSLAP